MTAHRGALVVDEVVLPVLDIRLRGGAFEVLARVEGPAPAVSSSRYTLHDDQGVVVYRRGPGGPALEWPAVEDGHCLSVTVHCYVTGRTSDAGRVHGEDHTR